ncbi:hypothetical protein EJB05_56411, partial [Eragrostis curvula]
MRMKREKGDRELKLEEEDGCVPPWDPLGTDVSIENMHQGFTHVFESSFESTEGIKDYIQHPERVKFANEFLPALEKTLIIDYKPIAVN